jgi:hypothetical protein
MAYEKTIAEIQDDLSSTTKRVRYVNEEGKDFETTVKKFSDIVLRQVADTDAMEDLTAEQAHLVLVEEDGIYAIVEGEPMSGTYYPSATEDFFWKQIFSASSGASGSDDLTLAAYAALGSSIKALPVGVDIQECVNGATLGNQAILFMAVYLEKNATLTGVKWFQTTQGNYIANNNNRIGLYSYSAGTLTLVASCANDGDLWKGAANTMTSKAFSSTYVATKGLYFIATLYCRASQTTAPGILAFQNIFNVNQLSVDFTNSVALIMTYTAQTDLPSSVAASALTAAVSGKWVALY